jgi:hypothetical protein
VLAEVLVDGVALTLVLVDGVELVLVVGVALVLLDVLGLGEGVGVSEAVVTTRRAPKADSRLLRVSLVEPGVCNTRLSGPVAPRAADVTSRRFQVPAVRLVVLATTGPGAGAFDQVSPLSVHPAPDAATVNPTLLDFGGRTSRVALVIVPVSDARSNFR